MMTNGRFRGALVALGLTVLATNCSGSSSSGQTKGAVSSTSVSTAATVPAAEATTATTVPAGAVDPNAKEDNPPGDIPDDQVFVAFTPPPGAYRVKVPEGWARSEAGGATTFTDNYNSIRLELSDSPSAPSEASARDEVPRLQAASARFELRAIRTVTRRSGPAVLISYRADGTPNAVTGKVLHLDIERYEFWRSAKLAVLTLSGPQGADNVDPWKIVTDSFTWT